MAWSEWDSGMRINPKICVYFSSLGAVARRLVPMLLIEEIDTIVVGVNLAYFGPFRFFSILSS